jgi:hypothetical protein
VVEMAMLLTSMLKERPIRVHDLAFIDAIEDCVEVLNGL